MIQIVTYFKTPSSDCNTLLFYLIDVYTGERNSSGNYWNFKLPVRKVICLINKTKMKWLVKSLWISLMLTAWRFLGDKSPTSLWYCFGGLTLLSQSVYFTLPSQLICQFLFRILTYGKMKSQRSLWLSLSSCQKVLFLNDFEWLSNHYVNNMPIGQKIRYHLKSQ